MAGKSAGLIPAYHGPPPAAPPSYFQAVGGVLPSSPFTPSQPVKHHGPLGTNGPAIVTTVVPVSSQSTHMICPGCLREITTVAKSKPSRLAYISGFIIALLGCFCGCCLIPCCIDSCLEVHHTCPYCETSIGPYHR